MGGKTKTTLVPWPEYTDDDHILLNSDDLLTVCEPSPKVRDAYLKKLGKTMEELTELTKPVILTEEEATDPILSDDDDYEPQYHEEPVY